MLNAKSSSKSSVKETPNERDIGPGDQVEFVGRSPRLVVGRLYLVSDILPGADFEPCEECGLELDGVDLFEWTEDDGVWCPCSFRKRPPHREALFRSLLEPTDISRPVDLEKMG